MGFVPFTRAIYFSKRPPMPGGGCNKVAFHMENDRHPHDTVDGRNPATLKPWDTSVCWDVQRNHPPRVSERWCECRISHPSKVWVAWVACKKGFHLGSRQLPERHTPASETGAPPPPPHCLHRLVQAGFPSLGVSFLDPPPKWFLKPFGFP